MCRLLLWDGIKRNVRSKTMFDSAFAKLSWQDKEELQSRIASVISTNTDECTTDADIRFFETQIFLKEKGLI